MIGRSKKKSFILFLGGASIAFCFDNASAQVPPPWCIKNYLSSIAKGPDALGIELPEAQRLVQSIAKSTGIGGNIKVVECFDRSIKASAWSPTSSGTEKSDIPDDEYLVYNPDWVREVIGKDRIQAIALFGHELGHFFNRHFGARKGISLLEKETEADHFAGCAVARLQGNWNALENLLSRIRRENDELYPNRLKSIAAAKAGFLSCGGKLDTQAEPTLPDETRRAAPPVFVPNSPSSAVSDGYDDDRLYQDKDGQLYRKRGGQYVPYRGRVKAGRPVSQ